MHKPAPRHVAVRAQQASPQNAPARPTRTEVGPANTAAVVHTAHSAQVPTARSSAAAPAAPVHGPGVPLSSPLVVPPAGSGDAPAFLAILLAVSLLAIPRLRRWLRRSRDLHRSSAFRLLLERPG